VVALPEDCEFPDPRRVITRRDFGRELTLVKDSTGLTVRQLARTLGIPPSTLGGYFAGTHLPALQPQDLLARLLSACGIHDPATLESWRQAYWRVKRASEGRVNVIELGRGTLAGSGSAPGRENAPTGAAGFLDVLNLPSVEPGTPPAPVSTRPPVGRLDSEPRVRGRDQLVAALLGSVLGSTLLRDEAGVHLLHGLGGCGKSTVALTVAQAAMASGVRTWWLAADDAAVLATGMTSIALELGIAPDELRLGSVPDVIWRAFEALEEPWLLVLDNVDDPVGVLAAHSGGVTDGTGWLRSTLTALGTVIVTTRDSGEGTWGARTPSWLGLHKVDCLTPADGAEILLELTGGQAGGEAEAARLAERLGGLPLALVLAGRYLAEAARIPQPWGCPGLPVRFADCLRNLDSGQGNGVLEPGVITGSAPGRPDHTALDRTWDLSLTLLSRRGYPFARALLQLLACFGASGIPYEELLQPRSLAASALFADVSPRAVWGALQGLASVGLVELADSGPGGGATRLLWLHPLVRDIARHHDTVRRDASDYLALITALLAPIVDGVDPKQPATWARWALLSDHCAAPLGLIGDLGLSPHAVPPAAIDIANRAAGYLRASGYLSRAATAYASVLAVATRVFPASDPRLLAIRHDAARLRYDQGHLHEAEGEAREVLALRAARLGMEHPDTLATQYQLGRVLLDRGKLAEAGRVFMATCQARSKVLGETHPDTLTSRSGIADYLFADGRHAEARTIYEQVLQGRTECLGARHPATLVTRHCLAQVRCHLGDLDGMEHELRSLLADNTDVRGEAHPRTLGVCQSLVELLHDAGRLDEAEELAAVLVADRRRVLGDAHPATLVSRHRLGMILLDQGALAEADRFLTGVLIDRQRVFGPHHSSTVRSQETIRALHRRRA
jgi:tetratricopeptide (TPR) repeat protein/transposase-like protein